MSNNNLQSAALTLFAMRPISAIRLLLLSLVILCFASATVSARQVNTVPMSSGRPNIVLINLDDADADLLRPQMLESFYPNIYTMAQNGLRFTNLHATTPFCAPSRAALFRGQYAFNTGVKVNDTESTASNGFTGGYGEFLSRGYDQDELGVWMKDAGYRTMHIGKYHHHGFDNRVPPGWDDFRMTAGTRYFGSYRFSNQETPTGQFFQTGQHEYVTTVDGNDAVELIQQQAYSPQPFFLYVAPIAPHAHQSGIPEDMVEPAYANFASEHQIENAPDLYEADVSDKPKHLRFQTPENWALFNRRLYISRVRAIKSVDDMIGRIVDAIDAIGATGQTYIFLTSDNGFQLGHHNIQNKTDPYQRTTNVPLLVTGPGVPANQSASHLLAHIDLCPTILDLAGAPIPESVEAKSFFPLLFDPEEFDEAGWQDAIMIENWAKKSNYGREVVGTYVAYRQHHEIFVSWANGQYEYYNLEDDPFQLNNSWSLLPVSAKQDLKREVRRFRTLQMDPIITCDPDFLTITQSGTVRLRGYCEDDAGVFGALITMKSASTNRYWNGSSWQEQWYGHYLPVANQNQPIAIWNFKTRVQTQTPTGSDYIAFTYRSIGANGMMPDSVSYHVNAIDSKDPIVTIADEDERPVFDDDVLLHGTWYDAVAFDRVLLTIREMGSNRYFNGNILQHDRRDLVAEIMESGQWRFSARLPPGSYRADVRGIDAAGNKTHPAKSLRFTVK